MSRKILCYVTDRKSLAAPARSTLEAALVDRIRDAAYAGVDWVQIREKDLDGRPLFDLVSATIAAVRGSGVKVLVNGRLDVAWAAGADGVHLGENSLPVAAVALAKRTFDGTKLLVGASCHSAEAARRAEQEGADYIFFGPVFATPSKAALGAPQGLERLAEVCRCMSIPVVAIGGITADNASACFEAGTAGVAAIRLFQEVHDLPALLEKLR